MSRVKTRLKIALKLQAIERARRSAAEMELGQARTAAERSGTEETAATRALGEAERAWAGQLAGRTIDVELNKSFAGHLLASERELIERQAENREAGRLVDQKRSSWTKLEASVRSGDMLLGRWRRDLHRRAAERSDQELADRTSWNWFRR